MDGAAGTHTAPVDLVRLAVQGDVRVAFDADLDAVLAQRRVARAGGVGARTAAGHHHETQRCVGGEVHLVRDDLEQRADAGFRQAVQIGAHGVEVEDGAFAADLEDEFVRGVVDEGPGVVHPAGGGGAVRRGDVGDEGHARLADVFEAEDDLGSLPFEVVADLVRDEPLLQAPEVEVAAVAEQFGAVVLVLDVQRVAAQEVQELREDVRRSVGHGWWEDGGGAEEALAVETGEDFAGRGEEDGEAQGEEVGGVSWAGEDVAGDLEMSVSDLYKYLGFEQL